MKPRGVAIPALRPRAGRRLPRELRAERVGALAEALRDGIAGPGFEQLLARIDESVFRPAARVDVYFAGDNAECGFAILDDGVGAAMEQQFESDLAESVEILKPEWRRRGWLHRTGDAAARRLAPLL